MKKTAKSIFFVSLILCLMSVGVFAQQDDTKKMTKDKAHDSMKHSAAKMVDHKDHEFITKVAQGGKTEVELGQLALKQATSEDVKQFAQRMIDDHSKSGEELSSLAVSKGITLPADLDKKHKEKLDKLAKFSGADFDREYMKKMVNDHNMNVTLFEQQAKNGKDAETKAWAEKTLPTLREHLTMARDTAAKVGAIKDLPKTR
jgi:putative membrane protein